MSMSTRYILFLAAWLVVGLYAHAFLPVAPGSLAWWALLGLPGLLVLATLAAVGAVIVIGLAFSFSRPPSRYR